MADSSISDHIGRLGEIHFDNLANRARLLSCRLDPDRIGRDRIVEFELEDCAGGPSYDTRPAPIGCSVQIKTVLWHTRDVRISLSNAMRMAGDPRPTFICVIRVGRCDDVIDMRFIHLVGDNLARVLERLRRASQSSEERLNKKQSASILGLVISLHRRRRRFETIWRALSVEIWKPTPFERYPRRIPWGIPMLGDFLSNLA